MSELRQIPTLRFQEFFNKWNTSLIENHFEFKNGLNKEKEFFGKGTPIINFKDVYHLTQIYRSDINGLVELNEIEKNRFSAKKGDTFFTRTSETIEDIGMSATLMEKIEDCVFSGFVLRARPKNNLFDNGFKSYCFEIESVRNEITKKSSYTTRALTSGTLLNKVVFHYPNELKEQQKIAAFLTSVDKKTAQLQEKKALLEKYKKGVMQKIFSQEFRFKDDDGNDYPDWEEKKLGGVSTIIMGQSPSSSSYNSKGDGTYLVQGNADINDRITNPRNWTTEPTRLCEIGDLILTVRAPVGAIAKSIHNICIGRGVCAIKNNSKSNIEFLYQYLLNYEDKWIRLEQGSTFTAVNRKDINSIKIDLPSIEEQTKAADFLSVIDDKIQLVHTQLESTQQFKKGLLQQMFV